MTDTLTTRPRSSRRAVWTILAVAIVIGGGIIGFKVWQAHRAYHFAIVTPGVLFRDGAKSETQFAAALDDSHPKTVVSLVDAKEQADPTKAVFGAEPRLCEQRGIQLKRIEVKLGGWPDSDNIRQFLEIVNDPKNQPVLVHCAQGVRRTGFFVAAYQESVLGYDKEKAKNAVLTFGHPKNVIDDIHRFIDNYDPASRSVPPLATPKDSATSSADAR
jgi:protein tyrosine phosphatase (PTP) superfamily phosphohydrolase (DUF442 family)